MASTGYPRSSVMRQEATAVQDSKALRGPYINTFGPGLTGPYIDSFGRDPARQRAAPGQAKETWAKENRAPEQLYSLKADDHQHLRELLEKSQACENEQRAHCEKLLLHNRHLSAQLDEERAQKDKLLMHKDRQLAQKVDEIDALDKALQAQTDGLNARKALQSELDFKSRELERQHEELEQQSRQIDMMQRDWDNTAACLEDAVRERERAEERIEALLVEERSKVEQRFVQREIDLKGLHQDEKDKIQERLCQQERELTQKQLDLEKHAAAEECLRRRERELEVLLKEEQACRDDIVAEKESEIRVQEEKRAQMELLLSQKARDLEEERKKMNEALAQKDVEIEALSQAHLSMQDPKESPLVMQLQSDLDAKTQHLSVLEQRSDDQRLQIEEQAKEIDFRISENEQLETQVEQQRAAVLELEEVKLQRDGLAKDQEGAAEEIEKLRLQLEGQRAELAEMHELQAKAELAHEQLSAATAAATSANEELQSLKREHETKAAELCGEVHQLEASAAKSAQAVLELQAANKSLEAELAAASEGADEQLQHLKLQHETTVTGLRQQIAELKVAEEQIEKERSAAVNSAEEQVKRLEDQLQTVVSELSQEVADLKAAGNRLEEERNNAKNAADEQLKLLREHETSIEELSQKVEDFQAAEQRFREEQIAAAQGADEQVRCLKEQHEVALASMRQGVENLNEEHEARVAELNQQVMDLLAAEKSSHEEWTAAAHSAGEQIADLKATVKRLEEQHSAATQRAAEHASSLKEQHEATVAALDQEVADLKAAVKQLEDEHSAATHDADEQVKYIKAQHEVAVMASSREITDLKAVIQRLEHERTAAEHDAEAQVKHLKEQQEATAESSNREVADLRATVKRFEEQHSAAVEHASSLQEQHEAMATALHEEVADLKATVKQLEDEHSAAMQEAEQQAKHLKQQHEATIESSSQEVADLKATVKRLEDDHSSATHDADEQIKCLKEQHEAAMAASSQEIVDLKAMVKQLEDKHSAAEQQAKHLKEQHEATIESSSQEVEDLKATVKRLEDDHSSATHDADEHMKCLKEQHEAAMAASSQEIVDLKAMVKRLEEEHSAAVHDAVEQVRRLTTEQTVAQEDIQALKTQLATTIALLDDEKAERIRQGARAETLEVDLMATRGDLAAAHSQCKSQAESAKSQLAEQRWLNLVELSSRHSAARTSIEEFATAASERRSALYLRIKELEQQAAAAGNRCTEAELALQAKSEDLGVAESARARLMEELVQKDKAQEAVKAVNSEHEKHIQKMESDMILLQQETQKERADYALLKRRAEHFSVCDKENGDLRNCNRELSLTIQQFKQENEQLLVDNRSLLESVAMFEGDLEKVSDRHAQLIGHVNKKQKIRYTVKLKEECAQLRLDLNKARHRLMQLEGSHRSDSLYGALASLGYAPAVEQSSSRRASGKEPGCSPSPSPATGVSQIRMTPCRLAGPGGGVGKTTASAAAAAQLEEAQRRLRMQEGAFERVNSDFRHLVSLIQRAVAGVTRSEDSCAEQAKDGAETTFADLLQSLRKVIKTQRSAGSVGEFPSSASARSGHKERDEPSTPRERTVKRDLNAEAASPLDLSEPRRDDAVDKENKQTTCANAERDIDDNKDGNESVRNVIRQINMAVSCGTRKLYGKLLKDPRSFFQVLDRDGSGSLDREEIAQGLKRLDVAISDAALDTLVSMVDTDENGQINLQELLRALDPMTEPFRSTPKPSPARRSPVRA